MVDLDNAKKQLLFVVFAAFLIVASLLSPKGSGNENEFQKVEASIRGIDFVLEVADTPEKRQLGLMDREELPENHGMVFIFDQPTTSSFWMKNTLIPLDMVFLDQGWNILHIEHDVQPCEADPCELYSSPTDYTYVIELNAGAAKSLELAKGDHLVLEFPEVSE